MPHHVLAMGTVLAALGAKAAGSAVDPATFITTGAAPLGKGMGSALLSVKAGKAAAAAAAPAASSFLAHGGGDAATQAAAAGTSALVAKAPSAGALTGSAATASKGAATLLAKGNAGGAAAKAAAGPAGVQTAMLKTSQKVCLAKKKAAVAKVKPGGASGSSSAAKGSKATAKAHGKSSAGGKAAKGGEKSAGSKGGEAAHAKHAEGKGSGDGGHKGHESGHSHSSSSGHHHRHHQSHHTEGARGGGGGGNSGFPSTNDHSYSGDYGNGESGYYGEEEVMPGPLGPSSKAGFLQVHQGPADAGSAATAASFTGTSHTATTATTATHTGTAAAAAAAADHAADVATAVPPGDMGASVVDPSAAGGNLTGGDMGLSADPGAEAAAVEEVATGPSKGSAILKGLMQGALGMEGSEEQGLLQSVSQQAGYNIFGSVLDNSPVLGGAAAIMGAAAMDPTAAGADYGMGDVDTELVEEQTMAVAAFLPTLFGRLSGLGNPPKGPSTAKADSRLRRSDSAVSTVCSSDGALSDGSPNSYPEHLSARRVIRSRMDLRKISYAAFLC
ncbi:hypothetical protein, conserved [Eimeria tenella]|uniref:Uncharacterized protein n=1 Tax=Eimeria tenella TaxID=5802 RepID=U6KUK4_EIMTE|nr:hypothetical protein, conserved [Eimeria tenella]CDJ41832.1 hypothetical protein, conserved [Eimeria tenella]|eukprot:XP_013232582.1 hypothetical protein, conserved [Eimeria tenella]